MKIFEFQFNPQAKNDRFFRVFSFQAPAEMQDQGNLYIVGELAHALPTNSNLLDQLATLLSQEYYAPEKSSQNVSHRLKNALKKANDFLAEETKKGNVDWLGNLHFLLLLFVPASQGYTLYFTKVGGMKLWLARNGSLVDAGKSIDEKKKEEGSPKVFGNVGSGKVVPQDRIVALTQEAFDFFSKENFLQSIAQFKEKNQFKNTFKQKHKEMSLLSGILLFALVEPFIQNATQEAKSWISKFPIAVFPLKISLPAISLPNLSFAKKRLSLLVVSEAKKRIGLFCLLCLVLLFGFAILGSEKKSERNNSPLLGEPKEEITKELRTLHKIEDIEELEVVTELNPSFAVANLQHMILSGSRFYFFEPSSNIFVFDSAVNTSEIFGTGKDLTLGTSFQDSVLLFADPETIFSIDTRNTILEHKLQSPSKELHITGMEQFTNNLYFLDSRSGQIFKSPIPSLKEAKLEQWLDPLSPKKPINAQSMSVDGNIWILTTENEIQRYFRGKYQESLAVSIFPPFQNAISLKTSSQLPFLYVLEPKEQRVVILKKSGEVVKQYRSEAFKQIRDFVVSPNGRTIYLFDGAKLYKISPTLTAP